MTPTIQNVITDLLTMNRDALAALVTLGAVNCDPLMFVTNATDRFVVAQMILQVRA